MVIKPLTLFTKSIK